MKTPSERIAALEKVGYNTALLPDDSVTIDTLSDSWLHKDTAAMGDAPGTQTASALADRLATYYPYKYHFPVSRGRHAEGILAQALNLQDKLVLTNAPFPSTAFHLESRGATLRSISSTAATDPFSSFEFKGDLDLSALEQALQTEPVGAVVVECCVNALGGHPISLGNLQKAVALTRRSSTPLYLDATRLWTNAYLIRERESALAGKSLAEIARALCAASDGCTASLGKDFVCSSGGVIAVNDDALGLRLRDLVHAMWGDGLTAADKEHIAGVLGATELNEERLVKRAELSRSLHKALHRAEIPVTQPWGGHGVYVDAGSFFPHLAKDQHPAETLAAQLYLANGLRTAPNMYGMRPGAGLQNLIRLALPLGSDIEQKTEMIVEAFCTVAKHRDDLAGLKSIEEPPGIIGAYLTQYAPR